MTDRTTVDTIARETVEGLTARLSEPSWLSESRMRAWEAYFQAPMPTDRDEGWRGTDVGAIDLSKLKTYTLSKTVQCEKPLLPNWFETALKHFPNRGGVLFQSTSSDCSFNLNAELASKGVIFCDIQTAIEKHTDKIRPYLEAAGNSVEEGKLSLLAKALFNCGLFLYVPRGVEIDVPLFYGINLDDVLAGGALMPRLLVVAEDNSKASLAYSVGSERGEASGPLSLLSQYAEVHVKPGARVTFLELQQYPDSVFMVNRSNCLVDRDGRYEALTLALGGRQTKSDIATALRAPGASSEILGIVLGDEGQKFSFNTIQDHAASDTKSDINFRVALKDSSASTYQGIVRVAKVAQRTDAYQSNKNLLLSAKAKADSIPKLEILADDVKCAHGATVGPVDREQIFYLMSRGLNETVAEELIVLGFFRQVLEKFNFPYAVNWLGEEVSRKILGANDSENVAAFFQDAE
ncbi:MAG: Fe-S cluster assembly protein SufD [Candidatus Obscuribacterales bacterium]|nr:Fe-S cluster assembly protein SufD [Candidatus Obscuribacterales bacterium]